MKPAVAVIFLTIALSAAMAIAWMVAGRTGRSGWIDAIWSFAVGAAGVAGSLVALGDSDQITVRQWLVAGLLAVWSLRLGLHITARTRRGRDDPRYSQLRQEWGDRFGQRLFGFLQAQAAAALVLVLSGLIAAHRPAPELGIGDALGVVVFLIAVSGEALADRQLKRFAADPGNAGRVCEVGLWRFSRHPNYFFEWLAWVAIALIAIDFSGTYPWGWLALAGPLLMYWLLVHVSGIPPLEAHMLRSRGRRFLIYQRSVNAFWPGPPRDPSQDIPVENVR